MRRIKYLLAGIIFFTAEGLFSQVNVFLQPPFANSLKIEDLFKITVVNNTSYTYNVYLYCKLKKSDYGQVLQGRSKNFSLTPGIKQLGTKELGDIDVDYNSSEIENIVKRTGGFTTGYYDICIMLYNTANDSLLVNSCISHEVNNLTKPMLVSPFKQTEVYQELPIFTWLPPTPVKGGQYITYKLRIFEVLPGQSPQDAIKSNPPFFEQGNLMGTIFQYPFASRLMTNKYNYTWIVQAYLNGSLINESDLWQFTFISNDTLFNKSAPPETGGFYNKDNPVKAFTLSGTSKLTGLNSNRQGTGSLMPADLASWELNSNIGIYQVPFTFGLYLSTMQSYQRQNLDKFSLTFDINSFIKKIKDKAERSAENSPEIKKLAEINNKLVKTHLVKEEKEKLEAEYKKLKEKTDKIQSDITRIKSYVSTDNLISTSEKYLPLSFADKLMLSVKNLGIGTQYPAYTDLTLNGEPMTGANIEINPGIFYFAVSGLKNRKAIEKNGITQPVFSRSIINTRLGIGRKEGSHFFVTYMNAWDNNESIARDSTMYITPMKNYVIGFDVRVNFFQNKLSIEGETAGMLLTRDVTSPDLTSSSIPDFVKKMFKINMSSSIDWAYKVKTAFNNDKSGSKVSLSINMTGPGYTTLGNNNLRSDNFGYEFKYEQALMKNQVLINSFFKRERDNLINWKNSTSVYTSYGVNFSANFRNYPYLQIYFSPFYQSNDNKYDSLRVDNQMYIFQFSSGYSYNIKNTFHSTTVSVNFQKTHTLYEANNYHTNGMFINHSVSFQIPLVISAGMSFNESRFYKLYSKIISFDLSATYALIQKWTNSLGIMAGKQDLNNKFSIYYSTFFSVWKIGTFDIRMEKNVFSDKNYSSNNYDEFIFRAGLTSKW